MPESSFEYGARTGKYGGQSRGSSMEQELIRVAAGVDRGSSPTASRNVWFVGDSITSGNLTFDAVMGSTGQGGIQYQPASHETWAVLSSAGRWTCAGVFAGPGLTAAQILSTHVPSLIAAATRGDLVVVMAGTNGNVLSDTQLIHDTLRTAGLATVACTIPPSTSSTLSLVAAFNEGLKNYCAAKGIVVSDIHAAVADTTSGAYQTAFNGDGVHPNEAGYRQMGYTIATTLSTLFAGNAVPLVNHNSAFTGSLQTKPLALASPTNGVEYSNLSGLGTSTIAAAADASFAGGNAYVFTRGDTDINARLGTYTLVQGHRMRIGMALKAVITAGSWGMRLESNTTGLKQLWGMGYPTNANNGQTIARFYSEFVVPSLPDFTYRLRLSVAGAGTVLSLGEVTIFDLTAMGLA